MSLTRRPPDRDRRKQRYRTIRGKNLYDYGSGAVGSGPWLVIGQCAGTDIVFEACFSEEKAQQRVAVYQEHLEGVENLRVEYAEPM